VLRDIFSLHEDTPCYTHTILGCMCDNHGAVRNRYASLAADSGRLAHGTASTTEGRLGRPCPQGDEGAEDAASNIAPSTSTAQQRKQRGGIQPRQRAVEEKNRKMLAMTDLGEW